MTASRARSWWWTTSRRTSSCWPTCSGVKGYAVDDRQQRRGGAGQDRLRTARPRAARRDDARHVRLRRLPAHPRRSGDRAAAGRPVHVARPAEVSASTASPPAPTTSLGKPINQPELFARVQSLLRIKRLHDQTQRQAAQLADWSATLERRVAEQVAENERLSRLKRFFSPKLAELIVDGSGEDPLKSRRREIVVVYSRPARLHRVRGNVRARGADAHARLVPRRDGHGSCSRTRRRSSASPATA